MHHVEKTRSRLAPTFAAVFLVSLGTMSCGSPGSVAVTAAIRDPVLAVSAPSSLAAKLDGSFAVHLELGKMASAGTEISVQQGAFRIVRASDRSPIFDVAFTVSPSAPVHLDPGGQIDLFFSIADQTDKPGQAISNEQRSLFCDAGMLQLAGSIKDATAGPVPVSSVAIQPTGCP